MKKRIFSTFLVIAILCLPITMTLAETTLAYQNDFSSGTLKTTEWKTWNLDPNSNGAWDIADVSGNKMLRGQIAQFNDAIAHYKVKKFKDVTVEVDVVLERGNALGILLRMDDMAQGYQLIFDQYDGIKLCRRPYYVFKSGGTIDVGVKYHVQFSAIADKIKAVITNTSTSESMTLEVTDATYTGSGYVGLNVFGFHNDGTSTAVGLFDNIKIYNGAVSTSSSVSSSATNSAASSGTSSAAASTGTSSTAASTGTSSQQQSTASQSNAGSTQSESVASQSTDSSASDGQSSEAASTDFALSAKYSDLTVDNTSKIVTLERELNVSEIKDSFTIPDGYTIKVTDAQGNEIVDNQKIVTGDMKLEFIKDGSTGFTYTLNLANTSSQTGSEAQGGKPATYLWIIIPVIVVLGAIGGYLIVRSKRKSK